MTSNHALVDGIRMRWEEHGAGTPVVFLHGIPTSPALWRHVLPLMEGARCLAWEMVGYGDSILEGEGRDISVARQADYLVTWMRAVGIDRAVLVGHDLGGGVAQVAAARHPKVCEGLVFCNSVGYESWPIPSVKALAAAGAVVERLPAAVVRLAVGTLMMRGHDDRARARESLDIHWKPYAAAGPRALVRQVRSLDVRDTVQVAGRLPELDVPARVVWGVADPFQKVEYGERFARDLGTELIRIDGGKHFIPEDHPGVVAGAVTDLLRQVGARRAAG